MATNKNQHFVPRCYLKSFTQDSENTAINLLNLDRARCIPGAPVKNQCSGDYFYGQDAQLEKAIQSVETGYAAVVARIQKPGYCLTDNDRFVLRIFILFQYMRTEAASRQSVEMFGGMEMAIGQEIAGFKPSIKEAVQTAMRIFATEMHLLEDLKVCLVRNKTSRPFVTSDNPAAMANRWHMEDQRVQHKSPGLMSCGLTFFLPLTPRVMCVAYDGDVYSIPHKAGWVELRKERDVIAFNEHQFLNAQANVYFREWEDGSWILNSCRPVMDRRLPSRHRINYAVFDKVDGDHKVFRAVSREEAGDHTEALIHSEMLMPKPFSWPSQLQWRLKGFVYTNGTGAGYIRAGQTQFRTAGGYWRELA
ncbi:MAG: DUF4238 domain-containing protein [Gallionellaceae bacterium]|jgi:hypothetical protein